MISEIKDEDILNFLMTSDFDGDYSPEELKYLLLKWRHFYRLTYGSLERVKVDSEGEINKLKDDIGSMKSQITSLQMDFVKKEDDYNHLMLRISKRKLSWKERISGKIINNDEN